jgi:hypothetical protein
LAKYIYTFYNCVASATVYREASSLADSWILQIAFFKNDWQEKIIEKNIYRIRALNQFKPTKGACVHLNPFPSWLQIKIILSAF